jgi:hypothetical protein
MDVGLGLYNMNVVAIGNIYWGSSCLYVEIMGKF